MHKKPLLKKLHTRVINDVSLMPVIKELSCEEREMAMCRKVESVFRISIYRLVLAQMVC